MFASVHVTITPQVTISSLSNRAYHVQKVMKPSTLRIRETTVSSGVQLGNSPEGTAEHISKNIILYSLRLLLLYFQLYPTLPHDYLANHTSALACVDMVHTFPSKRGEGGSTVKVNTHTHGARQHQPF
jgi:hypothetical protein